MYAFEEEMQLLKATFISAGHSVQNCNENYPLVDFSHVLKLL